MFPGRQESIPECLCFEWTVRREDPDCPQSWGSQVLFQERKGDLGQREGRVKRLKKLTL